DRAAARPALPQTVANKMVASKAQTRAAPGNGRAADKAARPCIRRRFAVRAIAAYLRAADRFHLPAARRPARRARSVHWTASHGSAGAAPYPDKFLDMLLDTFPGVQPRPVP